MRIKSVRKVRVDAPVPVYDVTVRGPENFKVALGPFVHNSKDVSDALAGVVYGLTMRREVWVSNDVDLGEIPPEVVAAFNDKALKAQQGEPNATSSSAPA